MVEQEIHIENGPPGLAEALALDLDPFFGAPLTPGTLSAIGSRVLATMARLGVEISRVDLAIELDPSDPRRILIRDKNAPLSKVEGMVLAGYESEGMYYFSDYTSPEMVAEDHGKLPPKLRELWQDYERSASALQSEIDDLMRRRDLHD